MLSRRCIVKRPTVFLCLYALLANTTGCRVADLDPPNPCDRIDCDDDNDCTQDSCDPATGACAHEPGEGPYGGLCLLTDVPDDNSIPTGACAEGVCTPPCDPGIEQPAFCPPLGNGAFCCPGSELCQNECL